MFKITVVNKTFSASDDHDLPSIDAAGKEGIKAALAIGVEEVSGGTPYFGAEIRVENEAGMLSRILVSVGASPIQ